MELLSCTACVCRVSNLCNRKSVSWFKTMFYVVESNVCMVYPIRCALFITFVFKREKKVEIKLTNKNDLFHDVSACPVSVETIRLLLNALSANSILATSIHLNL